MHIKDAIKLQVAFGISMIFADVFLDIFAEQLAEECTFGL